MAESQMNLESFSSFSELKSLLLKRSAMDPDTAAKLQPNFELELREKMRQLECDFHKADFERMDVEATGVVSNDKRFRLKKKRKATTQH
jgi:hypothetical protein